jgi:hypothetical protein
MSGNDPVVHYRIRSLLKYVVINYPRYFIILFDLSPPSQATEVTNFIPLNRTLYKSREIVAFNRLEENPQHKRPHSLPADESGNGTRGNKSPPWNVCTMYLLLGHSSQCNDLVFRSFRYVLLTGILTAAGIVINNSQYNITQWDLFLYF